MCQPVNAKAELGNMTTRNPRKWTWGDLADVLSEMIDQQSRGIPRSRLEQRHVAGLRALPNRHVLLSHLTHGGRGCEIGVDQGDFTASIVDTLAPSKLYLVDPWSSERYGQEKYDGVVRRFAKEIEAESVEIIRARSEEAAALIEDGSLDWVYIDSDHSYATTKKELELYSAKLRPGGILSGHDYAQGNLRKALKYGVVEAVHEFCVSNDWEFAYLTMEQPSNPSFALRKLI